MISGWAVRCIWLRYFMVFRRNILFGLVTTFVEPILYLMSFGWGVGGLIGEIEVEGIRLSYRQFIFAGILAQTVMFQGFFESAYGSFIRMYYQKIFQAMAVTPITISEILWGELFWDASRATFSVTAVCLIGSVSGDFRPLGAFLLVPIAFFCALLFAGMGMLTAAKARSIEDISYPQFLLVFPMFLFCGVFFPLATLPGPLRVFAWFLPLTPVVELIRFFTLGLPLHWGSPLLIICWVFLLVKVARSAMTQRLIK